MQKEWDSLTEQEREAFAAWHAARTKPVKQYRDMDAAERLAFAKQHGLPTRYDPKTGRQVAA